MTLKWSGAMKVGIVEKEIVDSNEIEVGDDLSVNIILDENDQVVGAVADEVIVATGPDGSVVDEIIDVLDADGKLVIEDETMTVYDTDANVMSREEEIRIPLVD
ncbi:MAG: hypothetical protein ACKVKB_05920 [Candidatus Nanopelagicales bacterium]|nr:hypothetical protein [Candidatus Nanopelagicales bacterium]